MLRAGIVRWLVAICAVSICACGDTGPASLPPPGSPDATITFAYGVTGDLIISSAPTCGVHNRYELLILGMVSGHPYSVSSSLPAFPSQAVQAIDGKTPKLLVVTDGSNPAISWNSGRNATGTVTINPDQHSGSVDAFLVKASGAPAELTNLLHVTGSWVCRVLD